MKIPDKHTNTNPAERRSSRHPYVVALGLSLGFHALVVTLAYFSPVLLPTTAPKKHLAEVELLDPQELLAKLNKQKMVDPKGQIVDQSETAINDETPEDARFLSRHNQKVVRETQSANHGHFNNAVTMGGAPSPQKLAGKPKPEQSPEKTKAEKKDSGTSREKNIAESEKSKDLLLDKSEPSSGDVALRKRPLKDLMPSFKPTLPPLENDSFAQGGGNAASATDDRLKNVPTGMQTLLSTREFVYFSYYNRIKDKLRQYWEPKIKEKMERVVRQGRMIASTNDKITRVVILLDERGTLVRVQVIGPSGTKDLDDAAVEAFRAAAPFPNPPKGIVEPDGLIRIRWDFILEA
jgi:protein TonB